jgi:hypothetical protein
VGSSAATCPMALGFASPRGELRCCHVFLSFGPRLPIEVGSGAAMCPMASGSASPRGELRCFHVPHDLQRAVDHRNKERPSCPRHAPGLAFFQSMLTCYQGACKMCGHVATVRFNSATPAQLTTHGHGYSGDTILQDGTMTLTMFSTTG